MTGQDRPTILLIDPPYYRLFKDSYSLPRFPLSLGYLAGTVRQRTDWRVIAYNADFSPQCEPIKVSHLSGSGYAQYLKSLQEPTGKIWKDVSDIISRYSPSVVGISCKSQTFASARIVARLVKTLDPRITVIAGGPHPSMVGAEVLKCSEFDVAVCGEGEDAIVGILEAIRAGRTFDGIAGVIYRKDGETVVNAPGPGVANLDTLCFPHEAAPEILHDYHLYPRSAFNHIFATRGCPYNCFFCGSRNVWGRRVRFRSPENVVREIRGLMQKGITEVHFDDDTFGVNSEYIRSLCTHIERDCPGLKWSCELHVKLVSDEHLGWMKRAGCRSIQLGIESGNDDILRVIRKGFKIDEALTAVRRIHRQGIEVQAFFMVGFPQETEETLRDTFNAMKKVKGRLSYSIFTPYPGTEAFDFCREHGLVDDQFDVAVYNHQSPANCFCMNISRDRFRALVAEMERMVDRNNYPSLLRRLFSPTLLRKVVNKLTRSSSRRS